MVLKYDLFNKTFGFLFIVVEAYDNIICQDISISLLSTKSLWSDRMFIYKSKFWNLNFLVSNQEESHNWKL